MPPSPPAVLVINGAIAPHTPPSAASFLESTPGTYTTARASATGVLWWPRHLLRLADSARLLAQSHPHLLGLPGPRPLTTATINPLVNHSVRVAIDEMRRLGDYSEVEHMALTALLRAAGATEGLDVCVHLGAYVPPAFGEAGARLAVTGRGREAAAAKYAPWARMRKSMEKMRPPGVTELLLTNDGDHILEGSVTNFFVVCRKEEHQINGPLSVQTMPNEFEVQTAPLSDGILPWNYTPVSDRVPSYTLDIIIACRKDCISRNNRCCVCHDIGIPVREVSPSWSKREFWEEAFVTSSLRFIQHVETVKLPLLWEGIESKTWSNLSWAEKQFQREISKRAITEEYDIKVLL